MGGCLGSKVAAPARPVEVNLPSTPIPSPSHPPEVSSPPPDSPKSPKSMTPPLSPVETTPRSPTPRSKPLSYRSPSRKPVPELRLLPASDPPTPKQRQPSSLDFIEGEELGRGSMGVVVQGIFKETGEMVAVKKIPMKDEMAKKIMKEVELLQSIPTHTNIVRYISYRIHGDDLEIFLEYVSGGNLNTLLRKCGGFSESLAKNYLRQIIEGLAFLHAQGIWWRDLKSANCLLAADGKIKLSDFGCSKRKEKLQATFGEKTLLAETVIGSIPWMAPEVITQTGYSDKADIWSLAILSLEMVLGKNPWGSGFDNAFVLMLQIATNASGPEIPDKDAEGNPLSENFRNFVRACLQRDPAERPSAKDLLEMPLFME